MARFSCLSALLVSKKKKSKNSPKAVDAKNRNLSGDLQLDPKNFLSPFEEKGTPLDASITCGTPEKSSVFDEKMVGDDKSVRVEVAAEAAYEGGDERDEILSMKRDFSDFDLQAHAADDGQFNSPGPQGSNLEMTKETMENRSVRGEGTTPEVMIQNGHVSDPGMGRPTAFLELPMLKRSCSNIETKRASRLIMSPTKSHSYDDLQNLWVNVEGDRLNEIRGSPLSVRTNCSADKVMLKKRSSSQVLPSRSRKLWWKLFLWSHRNLHNVKPQPLVSIHGASNQKGGYTSDTLEPSSAIVKRNKKGPGDGSQTNFSLQNQWVAFSTESSSLDRVNAWVHSLDDAPIDDNSNDDGEMGDAIFFPNSPGTEEKNHLQTSRRIIEEVKQANNVIQSLNSFSSVAHISGMGLKAIPSISTFSSLRSINLSGNFMVHITSGALPKSLHSLDLSKNKIVTIEGLRELTRLRFLNLSYNRILRIGHGLSNCTLIRELYLAGNKISDVEGLHRLLKLTVLDLSFNKITTAKALGQLVANYNSLVVLNLLGNPIQRNIGDDQLRKSVTALLPHVAYLNKKPIKAQRAREVATDSIAKAALGDGGAGWSSRRKLTRRLNQGSSSSGKGRDGAGQKSSGHKSKSKHQHTTSARK